MLIEYDLMCDCFVGYYFTIIITQINMASSLETQIALFGPSVLEVHLSAQVVYADGSYILCRHNKLFLSILIFCYCL